MNLNEFHNLNSSIIKKNEFLNLKAPPRKRPPDSESFTGKFYQTFNEELIPTVHKLFPKIYKGTFLNSF